MSLKKIFSSMLMVISWSAFAQINYPIDSALVNPFAHPREIAGNREIALVFDEKDGNNNWKMKHKFFDVNQLDPGNVDNDIALQAGYPIYTSSPNNAGNRHIGVCAGDFNGDHVDEYLTGIETPSHQIYLSVYEADVVGAQMNVNPLGSTTNAGLLTQIEATAGFIKLASGDFDNNGESEAVLLFREDFSNELQINIYDFDAALNPVEVSYQSDEIVDLVSGFESFDLQVADLDYDGKDEIIIASAQWDNFEYKPFVKVYQVVADGNGYFIYPREQTFVPTGLDGSTRMAIALTTGDFNGDYVMEIALAYGIQIANNNGGEEDTWLRLFRVGDDTLNTPGAPDWLEKTVLLPQVYSATESINQLANLDLDAGDVDGNGTADIVLSTGTEIQLFSVSPTFQITSSDALGGTYNNESDQYYDQILSVGDMNNDGRAEVVEMKNWIDYDDNIQYFSVKVHIWNSGTEQWQTMAQNHELIPQTNYPGSGHLRQYSIVIGDFDGDNIFFGDGNHFVYTDVVQPIVILNAPPTHSDNVGPDELWDVNGFWDAGGDCTGFMAYYSETNENSFTVQTSIGNTWSVSSATSAGFEGLVVSASASIEASYGESFSNNTENTTTTTEVSINSTCFDDLIYASIVTYDVYEYPLYAGDQLICYLVSIHPRPNVEFDWISTHSDDGQYFISNHEPGSLLSYRPYNSPQFNLPVNDQFDEGDNTNLSTTSTSGWSVTTTQVEASGADETREIGLGASVSVGAFGISQDVSGSYDWTTTSTHTSTIGQSIEVGFEVGLLPLVSENAAYAFKPYIFWGEGDEVVLDYEVNADASFYDQHYSVQDPAWNMPWRLDEERGYTVDVLTKSRQSKSLWFDKKFPTPGDTITVHARVFNYSLAPTESPVEVQFFFGNPYNGGQPVVSITGDATVSTDGNIQPQQFKEVEFTIALPEDFSYDGRLYARIDPDSVMTEVHEENNLSWRWLGPYFTISEDDYETVGLEEVISVRRGALLCYPNPANDALNVVVKNNEIWSYCLYNMSGELLINGLLRGEQNRLELSDLPSGMYQLRFNGPDGVSSHTFIKQ
jgi:hypothetical protein